MRSAFHQEFRRVCLPVALCAALAACSGPMIPPEEIDGHTTVSSIDRLQRVDNTGYAVPVNPEELEPQPLREQTVAASDRRFDQPLPKIDEEPAASDTMTVPENGINMDAALGVEPVGLAEEQAQQIAEANTDQPVVDGIGTETPVALNDRAREQAAHVPFEDAAESAETITVPTRRRMPERETKVALIPRLADPSRLPETRGGVLTAAERACRNDLVKLGVKYRDLPPISSGSACGIAHPVEVSGFRGGIALRPAAKLNCPMARMFARWVNSELVPAARIRYFSGIQSIHQMSSYSCRKMNSKSRNPWSEHARGNAIDIGKFTLKNGKEIDVRKKSFFAFREKGLLKTVREDSCRYFTTVLGPGDAYHGDHFHFDLRKRRTGYRHCSL